MSEMGNVSEKVYSKQFASGLSCVLSNFLPSTPLTSLKLKKTETTSANAQNLTQRAGAPATRQPHATFATVVTHQVFLTPGFLGRHQMRVEIAEGDVPATLLANAANEQRLGGSSHLYAYGHPGVDRI